MDKPHNCGIATLPPVARNDGEKFKVEFRLCSHNLKSFEHPNRLVAVLIRPADERTKSVKALKGAAADRLTQPMQLPGKNRHSALALEGAALRSGLTHKNWEILCDSYP